MDADQPGEPGVVVRSIFMNALSTGMAEIATIEVISFCLSPPKSTLVIQSGRSRFAGLDPRYEILVAREDHDHDQVGR